MLSHVLSNLWLTSHRWVLQNTGWNQRTSALHPELKWFLIYRYLSHIAAYLCVNLETQMQHIKWRAGTRIAFFSQDICMFHILTNQSRHSPLAEFGVSQRTLQPHFSGIWLPLKHIEGLQLSFYSLRIWIPGSQLPNFLEQFQSVRPESCMSCCYHLSISIYLHIYT